jgi:pimeloyl-ACP methyl ester carboxylesterase
MQLHRLATLPVLGLLLLILGSLLVNAQTEHSAFIQRTRITSNVVEYDYQLTTGTGKYDHIGLHRVIQVNNGKPIASDNAVLLVHGDGTLFSAFLGGISEHSLPVYLASQGVDVWGIDLAWTLVPETETHFTFMKDWGIGHDVGDIERALRFARNKRSQTGVRDGRLVLLGWSRGGWLGYALLNQETQRPCSDRQVKAYVSVDNAYKTDSSYVKAAACSSEAQENQQIKNGVYQADWSLVHELGEYAVHDPNGTSVVLGSPYTNLQASLVFGAALYQLGGTETPYYHLVAGYLPGGVKGIPSGLKYTDVARWNSYLIGAAYYEPNKLEAETDGITCGDVNLPFDKHLGDITVPLHHVGAGGGFGDFGLYTLTLLGSKDITHHIISFYPPERAWLDFGHADLFNANDAPDLVWSDILDWLKEHEKDKSCSK